MNFTVEQFNQEDYFHLAAREQIAFWSKESGAMVPMEPQQVGTHPYSMVAREQGSGQVLGYSAITALYQDNVGEFGGLVVSPNHRGIGVGTKLSETVVRQAKAALPQLEQIIAFANAASLPLFQSKLGAIVISDTAALPAGCWDLCELCPNKPTSCADAAPTCCDLVVELCKYKGEG